MIKKKDFVASTNEKLSSILPMRMIWYYPACALLVSTDKVFPEMVTNAGADSMRTCTSPQWAWKFETQLLIVMLLTPWFTFKCSSVIVGGWIYAPPQ